jgi:hypothetical protein
MSQPARPTRLKRKAVLLRCGADAQVRRHGDDGAGARAHAVDRRHDRLRAGAHRLDEVTRHAREHQQLRRLQAHQRADDLVDVAARAEVAAFARDDDRVYIGGVFQLAEQVRAIRRTSRR